MADFETVEGSVDVDSTVDPLYSKQKEGVARMRTSLLAFDGSLGSARQALNNITVLRMYHQVARVIRYIEMMDKIEAKMYEAIDRTLDNANPNTPGTWMMLVDLQEKLQKNMLDSHKLLQPYVDQLNEVDSYVEAIESVQGPTQEVLDKPARDRLRLAAQSVLDALHDQSEEPKND